MLGPLPVVLPLPAATPPVGLGPLPPLPPFSSSEPVPGLLDDDVAGRDDELAGGSAASLLLVSSSDGSSGGNQLGGGVAGPNCLVDFCFSVSLPDGSLVVGSLADGSLG